MEPVREDASRRDTYRALLVIAGLLVLGYILWSVRGSLLPFAIGALIAYLLSPLVTKVRKDRAIQWPTFRRQGSSDRDP